MRSRCHRSARALGTWLACHWWRRDGNALAGRVRRCCREAAAPPGAPFLGNDPGGASRLPLNPQRQLIPTRRRGGAPARSRCHRSARALGTWLACHWCRRDGNALAGRVRRCCREAAAPPGTPFLGNDPGGAWRLPLNPRSDDPSRLVDEVAHRCGRGVIAPPAPLGPGWRCHWWRRDGKALAGRVRRCCREGAAPPGTPFLGNDPGGAWRLPLNPRSDDSSRLVDEVAHRCGRGVIALPAPLGPGWRVDGGGVMARYWQDA